MFEVVVERNLTSLTSELKEMRQVLDKLCTVKLSQNKEHRTCLVILMKCYKNVTINFSLFLFLIKAKGKATKKSY